jgi:long-chain acyl-CoA synthetase
MGGVHRSRYADPVVPNLSLPAFVLERAADHPDHVALIDGLTGVTTTYGELLDRVDAAAARLDGAGVRPGDAVAIMAGNQPAWAVAFYATLRLGAAIVPLNPAFTADEVSSFLRLSRAKVILADVGAEPVAGEAAAERGGRLFPIVEIAAPGPAPAAPGPPNWRAMGGARWSQVTWCSAISFR